MEHVVVKFGIQVLIQELGLQVGAESKHEGFEKARGYIHSIDHVRLEVSCAMIIHHGLEESGVVQHHLGVESDMKVGQLAEVP